MRVITGKYKGRHFDVPRTFKARPTTDFAKENIFNVLRGYVDFNSLAVADLFAGTGSISLEFLSRGCSRVVSVEKDYQHFLFICNVLRKLEDKAACPIRADVLKYISHSTESFDIVFADPPYMLPELGKLPQLVLASSLVRSGGLFVLEHGKNHDFSDHPLFEEHRVYGSVNFSIFRQKESHSMNVEQ